MCGVVAILSQQPVAAELAFALSTLQHRGQDAAGIACADDGPLHLHKGLGFVRDVFHRPQVQKLRGHMGIGHVRYASAGLDRLQDAQPFDLAQPLPIAMAHNGNLTNRAELSQIYGPADAGARNQNDLACLLGSFVRGLQVQQKQNSPLDVEQIMAAVKHCQGEVQGAYAVVSLIAGQGLLGFCDPQCIRPLVLGSRRVDDKTDYILASESTTLDSLGFHLIDELQAGEAVFIGQSGQLHRRRLRQKNARPCVFENIYFAREDSSLQGQIVANQRQALGRALAPRFAERGLDPDIVIDLPQSGYYFAVGLAEALGRPYRRGLSKNRHIGRSFISPSQPQREGLVRASLKLIDKVVAGLKVAVVDDSIVRGTTTRYVVKLLREAGAAEIYLASASPPVRSPCVYGIDMALREDMIANRHAEAELADALGADALIYQELETLRAWGRGVHWCDACFTGEYPSEVSQAQRDLLAAQRRDREAQLFK